MYMHVLTWVLSETRIRQYLYFAWLCVEIQTIDILGLYDDRMPVRYILKEEGTFVPNADGYDGYKVQVRYLTSISPLYGDLRICLGDATPLATIISLIWAKLLMGRPWLDFVTKYGHMYGVCKCNI